MKRGLAALSLLLWPLAANAAQAPFCADRPAVSIMQPDGQIDFIICLNPRFIWANPSMEINETARRILDAMQMMINSLPTEPMPGRSKEQHL